MAAYFLTSPATWPRFISGTKTFLAFAVSLSNSLLRKGPEGFEPQEAHLNALLSSGVSPHRGSSGP